MSGPERKRDEGSDSAADEISLNLLKEAQRIANVGSYHRDLRTGTITWSAEHFRIFGYEPGEVEPTLDLIRSHVHPDEVRALREVNLDLFEMCEAHDVEFRIVRKDGETREVRSTASLKLDESGEIALQFGALRDVTEERRAERTILEANKQLTRVLNSISDYLWSAKLSNDGVVESRYYSPGMERLTDRPAEFYEASTENWLSTIHPEDLPGLEMAIDEFKSHLTGKAVWEYRICRPDGSIRWVRDSLQATSLGESGVRIDGVVADISEQRRAEEERVRIEEKMFQVQKIDSLGVFAAGIANEFNNILTPIIGHAGLALEDVVPGTPLHESLQAIHTAAYRAAQLSRQILGYSGRANFVVGLVDLSKLARETGEMVAAAAPRNVALRYDLIADPPPIRADATQIRQVLMNLLSNAVEAIGGERGVVSIGTGSMVCRGEYLREILLGQDLPEGTYAFLEVADDGHGMSAATVTNIFDPFFTSRFPGRGLGLSAVLGIVRGNNGAIAVESKPGVGTSVRVLFPGADVAVMPQTVSARPRGEWRASGTVLVVDDEVVERASLGKMLERFGFSVLQAKDGRAGANLLREHSDEIRCVIMDLALPKVDGAPAFEALSKLQPQLPVILVSGHSERVLAGRLGEVKPAAFIEKPIDPAELRARLQEIFEA